MYLKVFTDCLYLFFFNVHFQSVNLANRFNSPETMKQPRSCSWKCYLIYDDAFSFRKTEHSPVTQHVTCETLHCGEGCACATFTLICTEPGKLGCRELCREQVEWVACTLPPTGSLCVKVKETWPISESICSSNIPFRSLLWHQCGIDLSRTWKNPPSHPFSINLWSPCCS